MKRTWLTEKSRAEFAEIFDCDPSEVDAKLDLQAEMAAYVRGHLEYDDPFGYQRGRVRTASTSTRMGR